MSDNATIHYPSDYSTTSTKQRDTYMLIGFCFITLFLIAIFMAFVHRKCRKSSADAKQWFLGFCCAFRSSRSSRNSRTSVDLTASSGHQARVESQQEPKLESITSSYENPSYCELPEIPEEKEIENKIHYENTTCLRAIPVFDTEDDSGISDVSTSPKYMELHSPREYFKYNLSSGKDKNQGTLIRVLLPENLKQFSPEELARYRNSPDKRYEVVSLNRTLPNKESSVYSVSADYKTCHPHRHKLRRASSDVTNMNTKLMYENTKLAHKESIAEADPVYQNLPAESVQTKCRHNYENVDVFYDLLHRDHALNAKQNMYNMETGEQGAGSKRFKKPQENLSPNRRSYIPNMHNEESQCYVDVMRHFSDQMQIQETNLNVGPVHNSPRLTNNARSYSTASESNTDELLLKLARNFFRHKELYDKYYALDSNTRKEFVQCPEPRHYQNDILYDTKSSVKSHSPPNKRAKDSSRLHGEINRAYSPDTIRSAMGHSEKADRRKVSESRNNHMTGQAAGIRGRTEVNSGSITNSRNEQKSPDYVYSDRHLDSINRLIDSSGNSNKSTKPVSRGYHHKGDRYGVSGGNPDRGRSSIGNSGHHERNDELVVSNRHLDGSPHSIVRSGHHNRVRIPSESTDQKGINQDKANTIPKRSGHKNVTFQQASKETSDHRVHRGRYKQDKQEHIYVNVDRS